MKHKAIEQILQRADLAKADSDYTYFFTLMLVGEALAKTIVLGIVAAVDDDVDRNRYRLEHQLARADGVGDWSKALEDALIGPASQFLVADIHPEQMELTKAFRSGDWQFDAVAELRKALDHLQIEGEEVPNKSDLKRWFRLFATLRNKTRGHGATQPGMAATAAEHLEKSIRLIYSNLNLFKRDWAYLHRNMNGKFRVSPISETAVQFDYLKKLQDQQLANGVYVAIGSPRNVPLLRSEADLQDFFFANGGLTAKKYELLSYCTDDRTSGDGADYQTPPGTLPSSETEGHGELEPRGNCLSNIPDLVSDYIDRPKLEAELYGLLIDDKRPIVTLVGRGGIGKTSLALKVIPKLYEDSRYEAIVWLSARDIDLQLSGPKAVRPLVLSPEDMGKFYASLVLSESDTSVKGFSGRAYLEIQLQKCELGACLFVFDNFETTQNPVEMFNWIDTYIRLPNKALITTRLREFKGDYPVEVSGMEEEEAKKLIENTASSLKISSLIDDEYIDKIVTHSEGHPYVIKILLGEVAKAREAKNIPQLVAGTEDILTALFERTYAALSPCAQRAFLTLSAWNSAVPRLALESVLFRSTEERQEVERGIESLIQYSMAEVHTTLSDKQEFISLPLVASVFGKKKLNISPYKASVQADAEILQMLGPSRGDDIRLTLAKRLETFLRNIARRIDLGESYSSFAPVIESICRAYNPGWLLLARWHMDERTSESLILAKEELRRFLENGPPDADAAEAWRLLGLACYKTNDALGGIHAFVERAQFSESSFYELSNTANKLNLFLRDHGLDIDREQKKELANRIFQVLNQRRVEANADDLSRMAWLAIHAGQEDRAREFVRDGLEMDSQNDHLGKLAQRLGIPF